jgi:Fe-S-cluster containining protein
MQRIAQVMSFYTQIDQQIAGFQLKSGLRCLPGCGLCCPEADVQTTVLELLPAAHEILYRGEGNHWLNRIEARAPSTVCVFYAYDPGPDMPGNCTFYTWRPVVCRLFGFASIRDRRSQKLLSVCKHVKKASPGEVAAALALQEQAPCFSEAGSCIYSLDPDLGAKLLPINMALKKAILQLGLRMQMAQSEDLGNTSAA